MKKDRQTKPLVSSSRWLAYAAAGAATNLGTTLSAEAEIHYSGLVNAKFKEVDHMPSAMSFALQDGAKLVFLNGYDVSYNGP